MTRSELQAEIVLVLRRQIGKTPTPEYVAQQIASAILTAEAIDVLNRLLPSERRELMGEAAS